MKGRNKFCFLSVLLVVLVGFLSAYAQVDYATGTLRGIVTDPQGAVVGGATVTVTNPATGLTKTVKTGGDGAYRVPALPPGNYEITVEAAGFAKAATKGVELTVGQTLPFDVHLKVGTASETVEVSAENVPLIQTEQTQQANVINPQQVESLPNINRDITNQIYTLPGVGNSEAPRSQQPGFTGFHTTGFSIGGSNGRNNLSTIDGGENEYGSGQYRTSVPVDAIQEYQVNRNAFAAEFGFTNGSAINIVTKSGGNTLHGSVFGYFRDQNTEAANFFNGLPQSPTNSAKLGKAFEQNIYTGFTLGAPIARDKLFFYMAYEYQKLDSPDFRDAGILGFPTIAGPSAAQTAYVNALSTSGDPFLAGFAAGITPGLTPLNNPALSTIIHRDNGIFNQPVRNHNAVLRFDAQPNASNGVTLRFGYQHNDASSRNPDGSGLFTRDFSVLGNYTHTFSPSLLNQVLVQIVPRNVANALPNPFTGTNFSLGNLSIGGLGGTSTFGSPSLIPYIAHQKRYQFEDDVTWTHGAHTFKFGPQFHLADYHVEDDLWFNHEFDFRDGLIPLFALGGGPPVPCPVNPLPLIQCHLAVFNLTHGFPATGPPATNLSAPQSFAFGIPVDVIAGFNNPKWAGWGKYLGSFFQDTWKVASRLTLNAGVRLDYDGEPKPLGGNFYASPRLGFAWDMFGDQKTVLRAGAGTFYAPIDVLIPSYGSLLDGTGTYINEVIVALSPTDPRVAKLWGLGIAKGELPFGQLTPADFAAVGIDTISPGATVGYSVNPNYKNPYAVEGSLSIDRQLVRNLSLEVGYNMYHGVHLQMPLEVAYTQINPGNLLCPTPACTDITGGPLYVPSTGQFQHTSYESIGSSIYHGLTASLTKRYSNHLYLQVNYTFSKTIDNAIDFASFDNWFRPSMLKTYRAVSVFDTPHTFVANAVYNTPFKASSGNFLTRALADISLAPVVNVHSGLPFSVRTPSLQNKLITNQTLDNNFATPFGASRDNNRGAGYATADLQFSKSFFINRDRNVKVEAIVVGTNIFNRVNFNKVADEFDVNGFSNAVKLANGQTLNLFTGPYTGLHGVKPRFLSDVQTPLSYASADLPRQIQFGLKVAF